MIAPNLCELEIGEMVVYDPIEEGVLETIQSYLVDLKERENITSTMAGFSANQKLLGALPKAPVEALREISIRIEQAQRAQHALLGKTTIYASLQDFSSARLFPWHSDDISNAYVTATLASTEGLSGTIRAKSSRMIEAAIDEAAIQDEDLQHISTLKIIKPPIGSLISLPPGILHRSPAAPEGQEGIRLLVNGVVNPNFVMTVFG